MRLINFILTYLFKSNKRDETWINGFSEWFGSVNGFKQQTFIMMIWCLIVIVFPFIDPNMFHLMAFLTIYSALTQPILAFGNSRSNVYMTHLLRNNIHQMEAMMTLIESQAQTIEKLNTLVNKLTDKVEDIEEELSDEKGED